MARERDLFGPRRVLSADSSTRHLLVGAGLDAGRGSLKTGRVMASRDQYDSFDATELFCPTCKTARPVRQHLLLVLPTGNEYEYRCTVCGSAVGGKSDDDVREFNEILRRT